MSQWDAAIALDGSSRPVYLQIADAVIQAVRSGRLRPGDKLPSTRALAQKLHINRHTAAAAFDELAARGWVVCKGTGGTFVALRPPAEQAASPTRGAPDVIGFDGFQAAPAREWQLPTSGLLNLSDGVADPRLLPVELVSRAYGRSLRVFKKETLAFGDPQGYYRLREALSEMLRTVRGVPVTPDHLLITRGSQQALNLLARALVRPGDVIAVERLGHPPAWDALREAGAVLVPFDVDADGLRVDHVAEYLERQAIRALFVTPLYQFPTQATLSPSRRKQLLDLAERHRFAILEGDFDHEFTYAGQPPLPLAAADQAGVVLYVGSFAKLIAPGFRIGFVVAPKPVIQTLTALRAASDRQGDQVLECAVAELLGDRTLIRHQEQVLRCYQSRREDLVGLLREQLAAEVEIRLPLGGTALWLPVRGVDVQAWLARARGFQVLANPAAHYALDGRSEPAFRISFAALTSEELAIAVRRLRDALPESSTQG